jgi:hypothetical protein
MKTSFRDRLDSPFPGLGGRWDAVAIAQFRGSEHALDAFDCECINQSVWPLPVW